MNIIAELKTDDGKSLGSVTVAPKNFKTGSRGYYANGKIELDGRRYQLQIQLVEIGSKGTPEPKPAPESTTALEPGPESKPAPKACPCDATGCAGDRLRGRVSFPSLSYSADL